MSIERALTRKSGERIPARGTILRAVTTPAIGMARALQRRLGNQGTERIARAGASLRVSSPSDPAEREAVAVASRVVRSEAPIAGGHLGSSSGAMRRSAALTLHRSHLDQSGHTHPATDMDPHLVGGSPLPPAVRDDMQPRFGARFDGVRIHTDEHAARLSDDLNAHAFTVGEHVFFGRGQFRPDHMSGRELIAHELAHTIQQGASPVRRVDRAISIQREEKTSWWDRFTHFTEDVGSALIRRVAPSLEGIIRGGPDGVLEWFKSKASAAVSSVFSTIMAPVRLISGAGAHLVAAYTPMITSLQTAARQIAQGDCSPIREAADKIEKIAERFITPITERIQPVAARIKAFLGGLWDTFGAPAWDWIQRSAGNVWSGIKVVADHVQAAAQWIWDKTASARSVAGMAWTWLKSRLGVGEGVEGQHGLLQWVRARLEAAWSWLKEKLGPFKKGLIAVGASIAALAIAASPAGPILAIGAAVVGTVKGLRWIASHWGKGNAIVAARDYIQKTLTPPLIEAAHRLGSAASRMAESIGDAVDEFASGISRAAGAAGGTWLQFAASAVQWIAEQAHALANWARKELTQLAGWLRSGLDRLAAFLKSVLNLLVQVGKVVLDVWSLPVLLAGKLWHLVPACIREPIVDFIGPLILKRIAIFHELVRDDEAWQRTKADVGKLIRLVFVNHDLMGAIKATFFLVLRVFNVPPDLVRTIVQKAMSAWDEVSKAPLEFIKNTVRAVGAGLRLLGSHFREHVTYGLQGWLLGALRERNIEPPSTWTSPGSVFGFVLDMMGLSVEHVYELLKQRFPADRVDAIRKRIGQVRRVVDWVDRAIDVSQSPRDNVLTLVSMGKAFATTILTGLANWVITAVTTELTRMATVAAAAAATFGLAEVIDIARRIYIALVTATKWAPRVLDMVNAALDNVHAVASGAIEQVGARLEAIMHEGMPVVIAFLADQVGLGDAPEALGRIVDRLREKVDQGLLRLIDAIKGGLGALADTVKAGVRKLVEWWRAPVPIEGGGESHRLEFPDGARSRALVVHSEPATVGHFLHRFEPDEGSAALVKTAKQQNDDVERTLVALVLANERDDADKSDMLVQRLKTQTELLAKTLGLLLSSHDADGTAAHPYPIVYPKRAASEYRDIFVGPRVGRDIRVQQAWLETLFRIPPRQAKESLLSAEPRLLRNPGFADWNGIVTRYSPFFRRPLEGGDDVGLSTEIVSLGPGRVVVFSHEYGTGGGGKINARFRPYGFVPKLEGGEALDGDHVLERQLGGPDALYNLWPLDASENRRSGARISTMKAITKKGEVSLKTLREKRGTIYLFIRAVTGP